MENCPAHDNRALAANDESIRADALESARQTHVFRDQGWLAVGGNVAPPRCRCIIRRRY
jgi:hypothetical protein